MSLGFLLRLFACIFILSAFLYSYVDKENQLTELRLEIPKLVRELRAIDEGNTKLQYEIEEFESPAHLMQLVGKAEFGHLKHPPRNKIIILSEPELLQDQEIASK